MCALEFPDIESDLFLPLQSQGLTVLGVAAGGFGEDTETLEAFIEQTGVTFPVVWDEETYWQYAFPEAISPFPRQVLVGRDGAVRYLASEHRATELRVAVEAALAD